LTKTTPTSNDNDIDDNTQPTHAPCPTTKQKMIFFKTYDLKDEARQKLCTNQTGKFPKKSNRGHQNIMVLIEMNSNAILVAAMSNRLVGEMIHAYQEFVDRLHSAGIQPKLHLLDNECLTKFKERINSNDMEYQLVPPHDHRQNIAETAIKVLRHTSSAYYAGATNPSHCNYGTDCSHKPSTHSTCYGQPVRHLPCQHMHNSGASTTTIQTLCTAWMQN
jgi:hypothetical protein